jgi:hypothetical protein
MPVCGERRAKQASTADLLPTRTAEHGRVDEPGCCVELIAADERASGFDSGSPRASPTAGRRRSLQVARYLSAARVAVHVPPKNSHSGGIRPKPPPTCSPARAKRRPLKFNCPFCPSSTTKTEQMPNTPSGETSQVPTPVTSATSLPAEIEEDRWQRNDGPITIVGRAILDGREAGGGKLAESAAHLRSRRTGQSGAPRRHRGLRVMSPVCDT